MASTVLRRGLHREMGFLSDIKEMSGVQFDPKLVTIFFENMDIFLDIYQLHANKKDIKSKLNVKKKRSIFDWLLRSS